MVCLVDFKGYIGALCIFPSRSIVLSSSFILPIVFYKPTVNTIYHCFDIHHPYFKVRQTRYGHIKPNLNNPLETGRRHANLYSFRSMFTQDMALFVTCELFNMHLLVQIK